jgi:tRNA pseudouridine38-40 synthase
MRIALGLEYHGGAFCGWQTQRSGCAVQDALERALAEIAGEKKSCISTPVPSVPSRRGCAA